MSTAENGSPDDSPAQRSADERYGYTFTTRDETPQEYQARTEAVEASAEGLVPGASYRLVAGYAEHDHKFGGDATAYADSDSPLTRDEAQRIAEEAIDADARQRLVSIYPLDGSEMEARPSLNSLEVIRLLDAVPVEEGAPAKEGAPVKEEGRQPRKGRRSIPLPTCPGRPWKASPSSTRPAGDSPGWRKVPQPGGTPARGSCPRST